MTACRRVPGLGPGRTELLSTTDSVRGSHPVPMAYEDRKGLFLSCVRHFAVPSPSSGTPFVERQCPLFGEY